MSRSGTTYHAARRNLRISTRYAQDMPRYMSSA